MSYRVVTDDPRSLRPLVLASGFPTRAAAENWTKRPASRLFKMRVEEAAE